MKTNVNDQAAQILEVLTYLLLSVAAIFWWYGEPDKEIGITMGLLSVIGLWVFTLNNAPSLGLQCINNKKAIYFKLPLTIISTIGFIIGYSYT